LVRVVGSLQWHIAPLLVKGDQAGPIMLAETA
jgi:hypothetical protein